MNARPSIDRPATPAALTNWLTIAIVVASGIVAALQVGKVAIALPALRGDLGFDLAAAGWITSVFALLGVVGGIPVGAAVNRFGDRNLLLLGLITLALGGVAGAFAGNLAVLLGSRVIEGAGFLLIVIAAPSVLERVVAPRHRDLAFGILSAFMPAGIAIALLAGPALEDWRGLWLANAALATVVAGLVAVLVTRGEANRGGLSWRAMIQDTKATVAAGGPLLLALEFAEVASKL